MATAKFPKTLFEKEIGKLDEIMQHKIAMFGTTVESLTNAELEIDVSPNRPDLLSYQGFKRSFLAFLGKQTGIKTYKLNKPEKDYSVKIDSSVKDIRPFTACAIIKGLKFDDNKIKEIIDVQEKLHTTIGRKRKKLAIGIYPLEKITLPITYKALEPDKIKFIPLEMDKELNGLQILQRHPAGRDYAHLLAGKHKFPIFIDSAKNILSMPPIINSQLTGKIDSNTKDVFVECSGFDLEILKKCLNIIITTLADQGGQIYQMNLDYSGKKEITPDLTTQKGKLSVENTNKHLGFDLNDKQIKEFLEKMGHSYNKGKVESPAWRTDLLHEVDLIEDIAIAYGYDNIEPEIPEISTIGQEDSKETIKRKISNILSGLGLLEISNYHLTKPKDQFDKMGILEKDRKGMIEVEESKTDYTILRKNLTHYTLKILSENLDSEYPQKIFETGRIFQDKGDKIHESESLSAAIAPGNFTEIKQILEYLSRMLELNLELIEPTKEVKHFLDGRFAEIKILSKENSSERNDNASEASAVGPGGRDKRTKAKDKTIGFVGEIHPKILRKWKIKMPVSLMEIGLEDIFKKLE